MAKRVVTSRRGQDVCAKTEELPASLRGAPAPAAGESPDLSAASPPDASDSGPVTEPQQEIDDAARTLREKIPVERMRDPQFYYEEFAGILARLKSGDIDGNAATKEQTVLARTYKLVTDKDLSEAAREQMDPLERLEDETLLEKTEEELNRLQESIESVPELREDFRRRWLTAIALALVFQAVCRDSAIGSWLYTARDSEGKGGIFKPAPIHCEFFRVWGHPDAVRGSMIEAAPGHGKTTCFRGWIGYRIGKDPSRRGLRLCDKADKARKEIRLLKTLLQSKRYHALFPHIEIIGRDEEREESACRFTVRRPNLFSREPTMEAAASLSSTQGNGYDDIYADDICKPEVANQPAIREQIDSKWRTEHEERLRDPATSRVDMIYTPWHPQDTHGRIKAEIANGIRTGWKVASFPVQNDEDGRPISRWAGRFDSTFYLAKLARLGAKRYAQLYQMRCMPEQSRPVRRVLFYPSDPLDPLWDKLPVEYQEAYAKRLKDIAAGEQWLSIDPSATAGRDSTETAVTHFAMTADAKGYFRATWFFPGNPGLLQKWIVCAIAGRYLYEDEALTEYPLPDVKQLHNVLFEAQGGIKGQVVLWKEFILQELDRLKIAWRGSLLDTGTRGRSGRGQNVGKRIRLINSAGYLENGIVRFAGRIAFHENINRISFVCSDDENMRKLVEQILNFPLGANDGVDTVTQLIIWKGPELDAKDHGDDPVPPDQVYDPMHAAMVHTIKRMKKPSEDSHMAEEAKWIRDRFS